MITADKSTTLSLAGQLTLRDLLAVWLQFERQLNRVPIIRRLEQGTFSDEDYMTLLRNLRPQVVEGARWITRAASSFTSEYAEVRSVVIRHALEEHRDYELIENDYVACGGDLDTIRSAPRNIGTEALAAYLLNQASQPNPLDLLGAMFIIEGLGEKMANKWAGRIQDLLCIEPSKTKFLSYHGANDESHIEKLYALLDQHAETASDKIVKTAKVVSRLYAMQLEELDNV
ncbi:MAG: iron-containing redox enzyme family protein [Candidatus Obscuribacterales bacterium]